MSQSQITSLQATSPFSEQASYFFPYYPTPPYVRLIEPPLAVRITLSILPISKWAHEELPFPRDKNLFVYGKDCVHHINRTLFSLKFPYVSLPPPNEDDITTFHLKGFHSKTLSYLQRYVEEEKIFQISNLQPKVALELFQIAHILHDPNLLFQSFAYLDEMLHTCAERHPSSLLDAADCLLKLTPPIRSSLCKWSILTIEELSRLFNNQMKLFSFPTGSTSPEDLQVECCPFTFLPSSILKCTAVPGLPRASTIKRLLQQRLLSLCIPFDDYEIECAFKVLCRHSEEIYSIRLPFSSYSKFQDSSSLAYWLKLNQLPYVPSQFKEQLNKLLAWIDFEPTDVIHVHAIAVKRGIIQAGWWEGVNELPRDNHEDHPLKQLFDSIDKETISKLLRVMPPYLPPIHLIAPQCEDAICLSINSRIGADAKLLYFHIRAALLDTKRPFNQIIASIIVQALVIRRDPSLCARLKQYFYENSPLSCDRFFKLPEIEAAALTELQTLTTTISPLPEVQGKLPGVPLYLALNRCREAPQR